MIVENTLLSFFFLNLRIKADKLKIRQLGFQFSAHLSYFIEETTLTLKLEDNISSIRKQTNKNPQN